MPRVTDRWPTGVTGRPRTFTAKAVAAIIEGDIIAFVLHIEQQRTMILSIEQTRAMNLHIEQEQAFTLER